jgi:hypothetical protein
LIDLRGGRLAILWLATGNRIPALYANPIFDSEHAEKALA